MISFDFRKYNGGYVKKDDKIKYLDKAREIKARFVNGDLSYINKLDSYIPKKDLIKLINITDYIKENCDIFLVIGIGGSYMGSKAVIEALSPKYEIRKPEVIFLGNNLCSEEYKEVFDYIENKEIIVNVISKSGSTIETTSAFSLVMEMMKKIMMKKNLRIELLLLLILKMVI